ncbi:hypothetical protein DFH08DRAFT_1003363 [Mycena albidolilacea]|uniref:Transmembrane protein n=1 Tax=Mycena albidolilacea TaxID=1033008 RepID=A0AAD7AR49_9AGAR|nr:hypothetical protein DFH08DRAFT_1003363 [Mycena albidolilacea]
MSAAASVIKLLPPSAAFVNTRSNSLGPWVLGAFLDCILMGVIFCQARTYFRTRTHVQSTLHQFYKWLVIVVLALSMLKTAQCMGVVWVQNVLDYANPDVARLLVAKAWWQVSMPLMTGIIGTIVQSFFCLRFYMLSRNWMLCVPIICAMCLGLAGVCLSLANILAGNAQAKVMWLLVHLVGVFTADFLSTAGTVYMLRKRVDSGLERITQLISRLLRLLFGSAVPPTGIYSLGKVYVVSLLYTLNFINEYRAREQTSQEVYSFGNGRNSRRTNMELTPCNPALKTDQIFVQTQVATHVSPGSPQDKTEYISGDFHNHEDDSSSDRARYGQ